MNRKTILVIEDQNELSGLSPVSDCQIIVTYEPQQALSILMGGGGNLLKNRYSNEKVRPDVLLMHVNFFHSGNGKEFLELIKKYYSLKTIQVFLFGDVLESPDTATLAKYNIVNFLEIPFGVETLIEFIDESSNSNIDVNKKFWSLPAFLVEDHIKPFIHQLSGHKTVLLNSSKALFKTKLVYGGASAIAVASVVSLPIITQQQEPDQIAPTSIIVAAPVQTKPLSVVELDTFPAVNEIPETGKIKQTPAVAEVAIAESLTTVEPKTDTISAIKFKDDFKIQIVADSEELTSEL